MFRVKITKRSRGVYVCVYIYIDRDTLRALEVFFVFEASKWTKNGGIIEKKLLQKIAGKLVYEEKNSEEV